MKRSIFALLTLLASCALLVPKVGAQQAGLTPTQLPFSLSGVGQRLPTMTFTGPAATCAIVVYNSGGGFTLVPQVASDAQNNSTPTWVTATTIGTGSISTAATFVGNITGQGTTAFGGILTALTSGTVTGVESCTGASGAVVVASLPPIGGSVAISSQPPFVPATTVPVQQVAAPTATTPVNGNVGICGSGGVAPCAQATSLPASGGYAQPTNLLTVNAFLMCANGNTPGSQVGGNAYAIGCPNAAGVPLPTCVSDGSSLNGSGSCAKTGGAADAKAVAGNGVFAQAFEYGLNSTTGNTEDLRRNAPSPAPSGVSVLGYSSSSAYAAPIFCPTQLGGNGTTDALTQIIALSGTTHIYVCSVTISVEGTAAGRFGLVSGTGSNCGTPVNNGPTVTFGGVSGATSSLSEGIGFGVVFDGGAGNELCIGGSGTSALWNYSITYTQF